VNEKTARTGSQTKAEAQRIALELFSSQGYESTSMRQIAAELGISKPSLYYHFASKEDIVRSGIGARGDEAAELLAWVHLQPPGPKLLRSTVLRWVDSLSTDKLRGIRFLTANPTLLRSISPAAGEGLRDSLEAVAAIVAGPGADAERSLLVRMAFLSINAAVAASAGTSIPEADVIAAARASALAIVQALEP
jgi:AcrR family transcriptional regulator